jgi:XTP/dITP diphosphohydrolase
MTSSGLPSIGDDSGLCVDALEGAPGIKSRRWAGELNDDSARNAALIKALQPFPDKRTASFITCAALCIPGQKSVDAVGECRGTIVDVPRGENGFGYDPIFEVAGLGSTMAELTQAEKNSVSHRARAIGSLIAKLGWIDG